MIESLKMSINMRECFACKETPDFLCKCSKYFCKVHTVSHRKENTSHTFTQILNILDSNQCEDLNNEILHRLRLIERCKIEIATQALRYIKQIEEKSQSALRKLEQMQSEYMKLINCKENTNQNAKTLQNFIGPKL